LKRAAGVLRSAYLAVIEQWHPTAQAVGRITQDYARMIGYFASVHANISRQGTLRLLKMALAADKSAVFAYTTFICMLKVVLGPILISKVRKARPRNRLDRFGGSL
jgi:hypothetical protein